MNKKQVNFKYEIGQRIISKYRDITIIDRKLEIRKKKDKTCKSGYANLYEKYYKIHCNKCGFNSQGYYNPVNKFKWEEEYWVVEHNFEKEKAGCPCCSNRIIVPYINDIATTDPWMVKYFKNKEESHKYTKCSSVKIEVVCPYCGEEKKSIISDLYTQHSIGCKCGDGISYPNKFIYIFLKQLKENKQILSFETEKEFSWCEDRYYDFYVTLNNKQTLIIEAHGEQHYGYKNIHKKKRGRSLQEEQRNDAHKCWLAYKNGIDNYIQLDCNISSINHIKQSITNSIINDLISIKDVDWLQCGEYGTKNIIKEVCEYWNNKKYLETTSDIALKFGLGRNTVITYLKKGKELGWCDYSPEKEKTKGIPIEVFNANGESIGIFENSAYLCEHSEELLGVKLLKGSVANAITGKRQKTHKGFSFKQILDK